MKTTINEKLQTLHNAILEIKKSLEEKIGDALNNNITEWGDTIKMIDGNISGECVKQDNAIMFTINPIDALNAEYEYDEYGNIINTNMEPVIELLNQEIFRVTSGKVAIKVLYHPKAFLNKIIFHAVNANSSITLANIIGGMFNIEDIDNFINNTSMESLYDSFDVMKYITCIVVALENNSSIEIGPLTFTGNLTKFNIGDFNTSFSNISFFDDLLKIEFHKFDYFNTSTAIDNKQNEEYQDDPYQDDPYQDDPYQDDPYLDNTSDDFDMDAVLEAAYQTGYHIGIMAADNNCVKWYTDEEGFELLNMEGYIHTCSAIELDSFKCGYNDGYDFLANEPLTDDLIEYYYNRGYSYGMAGNFTAMHYIHANNEREVSKRREYDRGVSDGYNLYFQQQMDYLNLQMAEIERMLTLAGCWSLGYDTAFSDETHKNRDEYVPDEGYDAEMLANWWAGYETGWGDKSNS